MTPEDKQLLLKDLCARLSYRVKCIYKSEESTYEILGILFDKVNISIPILSKIKWTDIEDIKLYLRPMSSMTEEEKQELKNIAYEYLDKWENTKAPVDKWMQDAKSSSNRANFYNSHHLDWNGLIEKGLAIAVTEENNPYKN